MQSFANRLQKVNKHIARWANRQAITCYRIYDHDIPEFPFCIDRYEAYLHVAEYKTNRKEDDDTYNEWLQSCMETIAQSLNVPPEMILLKERRRLSRRTEQYEKVSQDQKIISVQENGLKFWVNLTDYLDTGLFLDHRPLRAIFKEQASGKRVLNLFSYTGAFSVYAAAGNAQHVSTVDLSNTYLEWAKNNFILNELLHPEKHSFLQSDVMDFLKAYKGEKFDLVFVDPPAFSNSKKMKGTWDTQRDHPTMLHLLLKSVNPGATIYFSNNLRNFVPDFSRIGNATVEDISLKTIPEDFRNKNIHHCYKIVCVQP